MQLTKEFILKSVAELLIQFDCVIIPGFGGFVATQTSAGIDVTLNAITPPSKKISFNSQLQGNDGLLANHLCQKLNIDFTTADTALKNIATELKQQLNQGNTIAISGIGKLYVNENQKIIFSPALGVNLLTDSFGLKHISLPKIKKPAEQPEVVDIEIVATLVAESKDIAVKMPAASKKSRASLYALSLVVIAMLFVAQMLYTNAQLDNVQVQQLSFGDISSVIFPNKKQPATTIVPAFEISRTYALSTKAFNENTTIATPAIKEHITKVNSEDLLKGYYIIAGSFKSFDNANVARKNFSKKGFDARIIPTENNYYRVGIYISEKVSEVNEQIESFRAKYQKQAWVMLSE